MKPLVLSSFKLCETRWHSFHPFYVSKVKGDEGKDWEWTENPKEAIEVSFAWAQRFMADRRACGKKTAYTIEVL